MARKNTKKWKHQQLFLDEYFKNLGDITKACETIGITRQSYYKWLKEDPKFVEELNEKKEGFNDKIRRQIISFALKGDKQLLMFWAKTQMKHEGFVERTETEISGKLDTYSDIHKRIEELKEKQDE